MNRSGAFIVRGTAKGLCARPVRRSHGSAAWGFAFACLLALLAFAPAAPAATAVPPETLVVVLDDNYPPYIFRNDEGQIQGILVDSWKAWEKATGVRVDLRAMDWDLAQKTMREGGAHVIDTIFFNEGRSKIYDFSKPYAKLEVPVFFHRTLSGISAPASLRGFTVGVKAGDAVIEELRRYGVHSLKEYSSYKDIITAAQQGDIRVFSVDAPPALYYLYKLGLESEFRQAFVLYTGEFHRAVRKGDRALLTFVEQGFASIPAGRLKAIDEKWLGAPILDSKNLRLALYAAGGVAVLVLTLVAFNLALRRRVRVRTSELAETMNRLRESEERYRTMVETSSEGILRLDDAGRITYANDTMAALLDCAPGQLQGRLITEFLFPEDLEDHAERQRHEREGQGGRYERRCRTRSGGTVWVLASMMPLLDADGRYAGSFGMFTDITERKRAEEALQASANTLRSLFAAMTDVILVLDVDGRYVEIAPTSTDRLYRPPTELLGRTLHDVFPPEQAEAFRGIIRKALETRASVSVDYRLEIGGRECWFAGNVSPLDESKVFWVARDITERKKAEEALFASRERLQLALDAANDGLWDWRLDTGEAYFSPRYYTMLGYEPGEFAPTFENFQAILHPEDREAIAGAVRTKLKDSETNAFEIRMRTKSGDWKWILTRSRVVDRDARGAPTRLAGTHTDITERKKAEQALQENEALYRRFSRLGSDWFHSCVRRGGDPYAISWAGGAVEKVTGYTPEEMSSAGCFLAFVHPEDAPALSTRLFFLRPGDVDESEFRLLRKDGGVCWVRESACCEAGDGPDELRLYGTIKDITERKLAEEARQASERRFSELIRYSSDSITILDADGIQRFVSDVVKRMLGFTPAELTGIPVIATMIHPEDRGRVEAAFATILRDGQGGAQYRHRRKDGSWAYLEAWGTNQLDNPDIRGVVVNVRDITERRVAEEALREKTALLEAQTNASLDGILVVNEKNERVLYNRRLAELFEAPLEVLAQDDDAPLLEHVASRVKHREQFLARVRQLNAQPLLTGRDEIEFLSGLVLDRYTGPVLSPDGRYYGRIWTFRDITDRKRAEAALRESEERYRSVIQNMQDIYYRTDADGRLVMFSPSAVRLLGFESMDEMLGRTAESFYADPVQRKALLERLRTEGSVNDYEVTLRRRDGTDLLVATTSNFYHDASGRVLGVEGIFRDITQRKLAEEALRENLHFLSCLERMDLVIRRSEDLERMMEDALGVVLELFDVDRAWLFYPADPSATEARIPMERTRPEYPGAMSAGAVFPMLEEVREVVRAVQASPDPVGFGPGNELPLALETNKPFSVRSQLTAAITPKIDQPWLLGIHQCSRERIWTSRERALFKAVAGRIQDALNSLLFLRGLRESEERYRTLFEQSLDAIAIQEGLPPTFTWVNPAFCELFGYAAEEIYALTPKDIWALVHPDDREMVRESLASRLKGEANEVRYGFRIRRKDGATRWVDVTGRRMEGGPRPMNLSIYRDVTERKTYEEALTQARDAADAANRAKSEFLANMSHEIRTPLNGIVGMIQLLNGSALDGEQQRYAEAALVSSQRLTRLLGDILDLSRIEARKFVLEQKPFRLAEVLESVDMLFRVPAAQKGLTLSLRSDATLPEWLLGDEHRLRQILFNLVGNAVKFTDSGQISVEVDRLTALSPGRCRVLFAITDTGVGIPAEMLGHSFQMFTQAESSFSRTHQGAGLGLAIVRHLVGLMGGTAIDVSSTVGEGTQFVFALPFDLPSESERPGPSPEKAADAPVSLTGLRVLLVEDEEINRLALRTGLARQGVLVTGASSGEAALEILKDAEFDCVLMDIQMPGMSGLEATQAIRTLPEYRHCARIPVIALTAFAMGGDRERFLAAGMDDYLAKPFSFVELARILGRIRRGRESG